MFPVALVISSLPASLGLPIVPLREELTMELTKTLLFQFELTDVALT